MTIYRMTDRTLPAFRALEVAEKRYWEDIQAVMVRSTPHVDFTRADELMAAHKAFIASFDQT